MTGAPFAEAAKEEPVVQFAFVHYNTRVLGNRGPEVTSGAGLEKSEFISAGENRAPFRAVAS